MGHRRQAQREAWQGRNLGNLCLNLKQIANKGETETISVVTDLQVFSFQIGMGRGVLKRQQRGRGGLKHSIKIVFREKHRQLVLMGSIQIQITRDWGKG